MQNKRALRASGEWVAPAASVLVQGFLSVPAKNNLVAAQHAARASTTKREMAAGFSKAARPRAQSLIPSIDNTR
ncbi:hypothetical protein BU25DRAFT_413769 [Macroventuria anomochaeta]|uniref:Uncharacterized protein n=1 Tax=Macroventuria anomochaeta TaxID=301207 RepID=A0ACB6RSU6_9PLEO|nr:uncharacterized protein BU25DRAFT_413769 [Macroventuria anomochaeta]KAF2624209.1 hypothetical protein BU25DRAFT_413769 [Macroventuria anomochaeta]